MQHDDVPVHTADDPGEMTTNPNHDPIKGLTKNVIDNHGCTPNGYQSKGLAVFEGPEMAWKAPMTKLGDVGLTTMAVTCRES